MALSFLAPQFLWLLLGVPAVVALHFIRARKRRQEVSALFLWKRATELARARRRFSPSWLLLLQILFVALASLALAQPTLALRGAPDRVLVFDASASMAARDGDGVRLEKARREADDLLAGGGRVAVVRAGLDATVVQPLTTDRAAIRSALANLEPADREARLDRAVALAAGVVPDGEVHLFTDQAAPTDVPAEVAERVRYHPVAGDAANLGVATFDIGLQQAYVAVVSTSPRPQEVELSLLQDGRPVAQTTLFVPAAGQANATFPLQNEGVFEARIAPPSWDALALDDVAYAGSQALEVVADAAPVPLQRALDAVPNLRWRQSAGAATARADVRILTGVDPAALEAGRYLLFAPASAEVDYREVRDWDQSDPLLRFVDLRGTVVGLAPGATPDPDEEGWEVLARAGDLTPVLRRLDTPELRIVQASFNPSQTDMVYRPAFPTLMANVLREFRGEERLPLGSPLPAGATLDGRPVERAVAPGLYEVGGRRVGVALLSANESRLPGPADEGAAPAEAPPTSVERRRGASLWLVGLALAALLAEWLLWSRGRGSPLGRLRRRRA